MRLAKLLRPAFSAFVLVSVGIAPVRAGAMRPWDGASARTTVFSQDSSQQGASATASGAGSNPVEYYGRFNGSGTPGPFHTALQGSASAGATGQPDRLLSVQAHFQAPNPGTLGYNHAGGAVSASASWTHDAVIVTPPVGGVMPDAVRLQFALTFSPPNGYFDEWGSNRSIRLTANDQSYTVTTGSAPRASDGNVLSTSGFDSVTPLHDNPSIGAFHLDLPLSKSGISDPFGLRLVSSVSGGLVSNTSVWADLNATVSLKDVTLPDGTPLKSRGYGVAFESGLPGWPAAVPEPAALACWGLATLAAGWTWRRRTR